MFKCVFGFLLAQRTQIELCGSPAEYIFGGRSYCKRHAEETAYAFYLKESGGPKL